MEILSNIQKEILHHFGGLLESEHFYLTGGTALAEFYLKHRRSDDLDFFTSTEELIAPFSHRLEKMLKVEGIVAKRQRGFHSFVELLVTRGKESTAIHLAQDSPFRLEGTREFPGYPKLKVDSLADIAANKLLALFGRASLRDFIDIYTLITRGKFNQEELIEKAARKDSGFDLYWLGVALERIKTFKDNAPEMLLLSEPIRLSKLQEFFDRLRESVAQKLKP